MRLGALHASFAPGAAWRDVIYNADDVHVAVRPEMDDVVRRALAAGADDAQLEYLGAGATGVVLCDGRRGFKVGRHPESDGSYRLFEAEAEFFQSAARVHGAGWRALRVERFDTVNLVIVRECVDGRPGVWADERRLYEIHDELRLLIEPLGWTQPEFKDDSYILAGDVWVLVDGGFTHRIGARLMRYAEDCLTGRRRHPESYRDLAYALRMEVNRTLRADEIADLHTRLERADHAQRVQKKRGLFIWPRDL